jgi:hypothetical protein
MLRTTVLPALMALLGVGIIVRTLAEGGGPLALGLIIGVLFVLAGGLRLYSERDR